QPQDRQGARHRGASDTARPHRRGDRIAEFISWEGCIIQSSLAKRIVLIAAGGLMSCLFAAVASGAAEIKVLTSVALTSAFNELTTVWTAGIGTTTKVPEAAKSFIQFLTGPVARPVFRAKGFQPG